MSVLIVSWYGDGVRHGPKNAWLGLQVEDDGVVVAHFERPSREGHTTTTREFEGGYKGVEQWARDYAAGGPRAERLRRDRL